MPQAATIVTPAAVAMPADTSLEACDDAPGGPDASRYCPSELLGRFALLMAGHGRCVSTAMMLGDREYAMWQLATARTLQDDTLRAIAGKLFKYFEERGSSVALAA